MITMLVIKTINKKERKKTAELWDYPNQKM